MSTDIKTKQLRLLLNDFELLSTTALTQLHIAAKLLEDNTITELYEEAEANEIIMDRLEVKIREEVVFAIFQFNPKAADLRQIIAYQDITSNLERVGDMLLNIIHFLQRTDLSQSYFQPIKRKLKQMLLDVTTMGQNAIFSFSNEDTQLAYQVIEDDDNIDATFHAISEELQTSFLEKKLTREDIKGIINMNAMSHNLERIGDSATNIAEATIYLTEGKDIRHGNKE